MKNYSRGFTLFEVLIVIAIMVVVLGFGLFASMDSFRGGSFRSDRDLLVALLQHARSQAINNICVASTCTDGSAHGVHVDNFAHTYTVFEGTTYNATNVQNQTFQFSPATSISPAPTVDVDFSQLDGTIAATKTITLTGGGRTSVITIDPSGRIYWTN